MEKKNRGTFKVDYNKTPNENLISLIKLTFPLEITMAKMKAEDKFINSSGEIEINGVTIRTTQHYKWERQPKETRDIHAFTFNTRYLHNGYRSSITRSVPVQTDGKVSLTKITKILSTFSELNKEWQASEAIRKQKEAEEQKIREANERKLNKLVKEVKLPSNASLQHSSWEATCDTYDIHIDEVNEEQARTIAEVIRKVMGKC